MGDKQRISFNIRVSTLQKALDMAKKIGGGSEKYITLDVVQPKTMVLPSEIRAYGPNNFTKKIQ